MKKNFKRLMNSGSSNNKDGVTITPNQVNQNSAYQQNGGAKHMSDRDRQEAERRKLVYAFGRLESDFIF